jgi:hypothetical protein
VIPPQLGPLTEDDADTPDVAHPIVHRIHAQRLDATRIGGEQPRQQLDGRALAGAVRAGVSHDFAAPHSQVDTPQRLDQPDLGSQQIAKDVGQARRSDPLAGHLRDA